jgi:pathogenicity locus Cdd1 protein
MTHHAPVGWMLLIVGTLLPTCEPLKRERLERIPNKISRGADMRAKCAQRAKGLRDLARLEDVPNVGRAVAADLRRLGITTPAELLGRDPYAMYDDLCRITGQRHDPCLLDTFIAAVRSMAGEPRKPWWKYTAERKRQRAARAGSEDPK